MCHKNCLAAGIAVGVLLGNVALAEDIAVEAAASRQQLVDEIGGVESTALRTKLLNAARPSLAHWYAGEVFRDGRWMTLKESEQHAAEDENLSAYRNLRNEFHDTAEGHEKLARWCQKQELIDLANMHWLHVLRFQPNHNTALAKLKLRWHDGVLLAEEEVERYQEKQRQRIKALKQWRKTAKRLRRELENGELPQQQAARAELWEIRDVAAVPALVEEFIEEGPKEQTTINRRTELVAALGHIDARAATEALVRFAVESPRDSIRYAAVDQLKTKPREDYVPILLSGMRMPIEASVSINEIGNQIVSSYRYVQEGHAGQEYRRQRDSSYSISGRRYNSAPTYAKRRVPERKLSEGYTIPERTLPAYECNGHTVHARHLPSRYVPPRYDPEHIETYRTGTATSRDETPEYQARKQLAIRQSRTNAAGEAKRVERRNANIEQQNAQIAEVLTELTGETLSMFPKSWWNWWSDQLESHPESATAGARRRWSLALLNKNPRGFSRGTWVWTLGGRVPVETILPGDFVLAQDPATGELDYKVVLAIASPRSLAISMIELERGALHCASGQVVWTAGHGWRQVSKLAVGETLHGVRNSVRVKQVAEEFTIDSYDLVVEGFHTLFIGESGVLVHDATPVGPTHVALPGFSPAAVADAAHLASLPR